MMQLPAADKLSTTETALEFLRDLPDEIRSVLESYGGSVWPTDWYASEAAV